MTPLLMPCKALQLVPRFLPTSNDFIFKECEYSLLFVCHLVHSHATRERLKKQPSTSNAAQNQPGKGFIPTIEELAEYE